jgi:hypothetical protein
MTCNCGSRWLWTACLYSLFCGEWILVSGQALNISPWTHRSVISMTIPITFPAASRIKIGATVTKLTTIEDGCVLGWVEVMYCWRILAWIPLSRNWAKLWRNIAFIYYHNRKLFYTIILKQYCWQKHLCIVTYKQDNIKNHK